MSKNMIRPVSEIEYPPSQAALAKASMIARMESLKSSGDALMSVIACRIGAERSKDFDEVDRLTGEQERLIANMKAMALA
jgi:hypothetical protein